MPKKQTMWETEDGKFFNTLAEAHSHEMNNDLIDYINDHPIDALGIDAIIGQDVINWLEINNRLHLTLEKVIENESNTNI